MPTTATKLATDALFTQYLNVVNRSLGQNRETFPYKQILDASEKAFDDKTVAVGIYSEDPSQPHDWFVVAYDGGTFSLQEHGKGEADLTWKMKEAHLDEVVENPERYVESPYKLDLDWLKKTVGVS